MQDSAVYPRTGAGESGSVIVDEDGCLLGRNPKYRQYGWLWCSEKSVLSGEIFSQNTAKQHQQQQFGSRGRHMLF